MKMYIVLKNNGEEYECYREWIDKVFLKKEVAKTYVKKEMRKKSNKLSNIDPQNIFDIEEHEIIESGGIYK